MISNLSTIEDIVKQKMDFYRTYITEVRGEKKKARVWGYGRNFTVHGSLDREDMYHKPLTEDVLNIHNYHSFVYTYFIHHAKTEAKTECNRFNKKHFCQMCCLEEAIRKFYGTLIKNKTYVPWLKGYEVVLHSPMLCGPCYREAEEERIAFRAGA